MDFHALIAEKLTAVSAQADVVADCIRDTCNDVNGVMFNVEGGIIEGAAKDLLIKAVTDFQIPEHSAGTAVVTRYIGCYCVSEPIALQMALLNARKDELREVCALAKAAGFGWRDFRSSFASTGLRRVHALQATRHLKMLPMETESVAFTSTERIKSIKKASLEWVMAWLNKQEAFDVLREINKRGYTDDVVVRVVRPVAPHVRANIKIGGENTMMAAGVPFIIPYPAWRGVVRFNPPKANRQAIRSDSLERVFSSESIPLPFLDDAYLTVHYP